ncbi:MAG: efflux RND transporter permease subunit [Beijerinckiaceae bacterium]|nr:efflux RND transporter permease subunit [Beijerinckiaceae bacterium]MCZ8300790.1 efflux RND transporter permease subunit [Beijerinckiaceae bacterium]
MNGLIHYSIAHARLTIAAMVFLLVAGVSAYLSIPKEAEPDVQVPIVYVSVTQRGISPEDAERLILRPLETQLKSVANVKEMRASAFEGGGFVLLEFQPGFDSRRAIADVRAKVDDAKRDLPRDADEPKVVEVNLSLFPVIIVAMKGEVPEQTMVRLARQLRTAIEQVPGVLSAELKGARDEVVEIIVEPTLLAAYGVSLDDLIRIVSGSNTLIAAGSLENQSGRFAIKVPSLIERPQDILDLPVLANAGAVVRLGDVAEVRPTFKDATTITRVDGKPAITIEVAKRAGANLIDTVDGVKYVLEKARPLLPATIELSTTQDRSITIRTMLGDLQNSVISGVLLVAIVILATLGFRASLLVGLAVPFSFLAGILALQLSGLTVNIVVLFSLILAVGELVDDAIIVTEFAERRMAEGVAPKEAYALAASRMTGPVIAATTTRVAAFSPLLFWPGIVGEFMKYLPLTLIATLAASLVYALFFVPAIGALIGKSGTPEDGAALSRRGPYMRAVSLALDHPGKTILLTIAMLIAIPMIHAKVGKGVEFFPEVEPDYALVQVRARGNLSLTEKDRIVRQVEQRLLGMSEIQTVYTRLGEMARGGNDELSPDTIGLMQFELIDWQKRRKATEIMEDIRQKTADIPGIEIAVTKPKAGPPTGKPIQIELSAFDPALLDGAAKKVAAMLSARPDITDLDTGLPLPGIDWTLRLDRGEAAKVGAGAGTVGTAVQLVTNGVKLTEYRPATADKSVDVLLRFPPGRRSLDQLDEMLVNTPAGPVPIGTLVKREATRSVGTLNRVNATRVINLSANLAAGAQSAEVQKEVTEALGKLQLGDGVFFRLKGEDEERAKASAFLSKAFGAALFMIFAILLAQFNSFTSVGLILSSVVLALIGVFIGLIVMDQPFGVVMTGLGIISLAGVIVNNNIVLIDTYDMLRREGMAAREAILRTCAERARPVVMTAASSVLGVAPIAFGINIDFILRDVSIGAPATQWWVQLSTAMLFGLSFATVLTLIVTPAALQLVANGAAWRERRRARRLAPAAA